MSPLWIAIAAAVMVVLAHMGLFWWFLCKGRKDDAGGGSPESSTDKKDRDDGQDD